MNATRIRKMVTTAILIALAIAFQNLRLVLGGNANPISPYIIGTLVNLCLIVAACVVGVWSGLSVAVITPLIALLQAYAQAPMVPWIIAGNAVLVIVYALLAGDPKSKRLWVRWALAGSLAAALKYAVIAIGQTTVLSSAKGLAFGVALGTAAAAQIQQLITGLIAMVIARLVIAALPNSVIKA